MDYFNLKKLLSLIFELRIKDSDITKISERSGIPIGETMIFTFNEVKQIIDFLFGYVVRSDEFLFLTTHLALRELKPEDLKILMDNYCKLFEYSYQLKKGGHFYKTGKMTNEIFNLIYVGIVKLFLTGSISKEELALQIDKIEKELKKSTLISV